MRLIQERTGVPPSEQKLFCCGKQLKPEKKLKRYLFLGFGKRQDLFLTRVLKGGLILDKAIVDEFSGGHIKFNVVSHSVRISGCHGVGPQSLTAYCRILRDTGQFRIMCPYADDFARECGCLWSWSKVMPIINPHLPYEEKNDFENQILMNESRFLEVVGVLSLIKNLIVYVLDRRSIRARYEMVAFSSIMRLWMFSASGRRE